VEDTRPLQDKLALWGSKSPSKKDDENYNSVSKKYLPSNDNIPEGSNSEIIFLLTFF
jgi:hypothetical protein